MSSIKLEGQPIGAPDKKFTEYDVDFRHAKTYIRNRELPEWVPFRETNKIGKVGELALVNILKNKHEVKTHTSNGMGPSGRGWLQTGNYIVEFESKDRNGNIKPSGIMAPDLDDDATFWNVLEHEGRVVYVAKCKVSRMRRYIKKRLDDPQYAHTHGWWGNGGCAHSMKVPIPESDPEAEEAMELIEDYKKGEKERSLTRNVRLKEAWQKYKKENTNDRTTVRK